MRNTGQGDELKGSSRLDAALRVVAGVTETVGQEHIELVTFTREGLEVQVRGALRQLTGTTW